MNKVSVFSSKTDIYSNCDAIRYVSNLGCKQSNTTSHSLLILEKTKKLLKMYWQNKIDCVKLA